jgi:pimeloyl-ACP methyl ester carboxylesterase
MPNPELNGINIYYERSGAGERLLFLNGSGSSLANSGLMVKPFAKHFDVLAHDQRGLGKTSKPVGPYEMTDYAADAAALLDHIGWKSCRVVGVSFGGMVAQELAIRYPGRVERLALLCTSPGGIAPSYPLHKDGRFRPELLDTRFTDEYLEEHADAKGLVAVMKERRAERKTERELRGMWEQLLARSRHDVVDRLHLITAPTFVGCGRYDGTAPPANSELIAEKVPNADLHYYEGGHAFMYQDRQAFKDVIEFLGRR